MLEMSIYFNYFVDLICGILQHFAMQNSTVTSEESEKCSSPPSIPPPPPPLPAKSNLSIQDCKCMHACSKELKLLRKSPKEDILSAVRHITYQFYVENPSDLISLYYPVSPVIQEGRCCGIVALSMASQLINNVSSNDILSLAKSLNYTRAGEMFSVYNMSELAKTLLHCDTVVMHNLDVFKEDILEFICDGCPLLIPYDADRNHFPCSNNGITAHWAVISGVGFTVTDKNLLSTLINYEVIRQYPELNIFLVKDAPCIKRLLKNSDKIFVYAHQGKSKHLAAWDLNDLLESNKNMHEVTKKYSSEELVLPPDDPLSELRNKAVVLLKKKI